MRLMGLKFPIDIYTSHKEYWRTYKEMEQEAIKNGICGN